MPVGSVAAVEEGGELEVGEALVTGVSSALVSVDAGGEVSTPQPLISSAKAAKAGIILGAVERNMMFSPELRSA